MAIAKKCGLWALIAWLLAVGGAKADMGVTPLRQVLTADHPEAEFVVSNPSDRIIDGHVSWIDMAATETGYEPADPALRERLSAAPWLVVSPAQFRLKPGARLTISVRLKDGAHIPPGERRSHLLIETEATRTPIRKASNSGLQVDVGLGVSAPVILRNGGKAIAKIDNVRLLRDEDGMLELETTIAPKGDNSSYGRLRVLFTPDDGAEAQELGVRENVAGFTDAERRIVSIPFGMAALSAGELTVRYEGTSEYNGVLFDSRAFQIAPPTDE